MDKYNVNILLFCFDNVFQNCTAFMIAVWHMATIIGQFLSQAC